MRKLIMLAMLLASFGANAAPVSLAFTSYQWHFARGVYGGGATNTYDVGEDTLSTRPHMTVRSPRSAPMGPRRCVLTGPRSSAAKKATTAIHSTRSSTWVWKGI